MRRASRQDPESNKLQTGQDNDRGKALAATKLPLCTRAPAHPPMCRPGTFPGARGKRLCSQRCTVASGANKKAIVAISDAPDGLILHYLGDADGHLMPLSPAARARYDTL